MSASIGYFEVDGVRLRADPARDACFRLVHRDSEMIEHDGQGPLARREMVHRHMSNEITSLDIAADCLAEFRDAAWELRLELARQCWDESRHVQALHRQLVAMGGRKGEFPISAFEWNVTCAVDGLAGRLATQNRTFEAGAMDVVAGMAPALRDADPEIARLLEDILADEIQHVRFANRWIKRLAAQDPRTLLGVAMAMRFLARANAALSGRAGAAHDPGRQPPGADERVPAVNVDDRRLAEFSDEEIAEILRQAGFRSLLRDDAGSSP